MKSNVSIAVLTVIQPELFAALDALKINPKTRTKDPVGTVYYQGQIHSELTSKNYSVLLSCIGRAGNRAAAVAAQDIISNYQPQVLILVGIAAGIRGKTKIGDVILSERVVAYEPAALVRTTEGDLKTEPRPDIRRVAQCIIQDLVNYRPPEARLRERFVRIKGDFPRPSQGNDTLFDTHVTSHISIRTSTIASGEKLLRNPEKLFELRALHGQVEAAEMEVAGLMEACERSGIPWITIRGISDFGDEFKDDRFHDFAARTAASVLADFIEHGLELPSPTEDNTNHPYGAPAITAAANEEEASNKTAVNKIETGNKTAIRIGNTQSKDPSETSVGEIKSGDECVIEIGNKTSKQ